MKVGLVFLFPMHNPRLHTMIGLVITLTLREAEHMEQEIIFHMTGLITLIPGIQLAGIKQHILSMETTVILFMKMLYLKMVNLFFALQTILILVM